MENKQKTTEYCKCFIYLSNGEGACSFCGLPMKPIVIRKQNKNES